MSEALRVAIGQHSAPGHSGLNQDFHGASLPEGHLRASKGIALALADGIGSSAVSQIASAAAVRTFLEDYFATSEAWSARRSAERVLNATNAWLHAQNQRSDDARFDKDRGHVCTFSALILKGRRLHLLHVGDARVYRVHAQSLEQLTEDHRVTLGGGESYLGRALGVGPHVEIDYRCWDAEPGDIYLLATDGAHAHLDVAAVQAALAHAPDDLDAVAHALVKHAQARGSEDDATVQLLRIDSLPTPDAPLQITLREGLALPPALAVGRSFEGYTLVRELHHSARSQVWLATDDATGARAVLKLPAAELREQPALLDRFALEEWIARRIDSPHVVRAATAERPRRHLCVALDYIEGSTLAQWMVDHPAPPLDAVRGIVSQVAKGLQALHRREMLHQDLRPENVMLDRQGTVRLIDLGSAHVAGLAEAHAVPEAREIVGTLQYTAPEYFTGHGGSERAELFALAVLSYQMLSGQLPFGLDAVRIRTPADARRLRYRPLRQFRPDLPPWLDNVLHKALQPDPARRQEAVSEFVFDLHTPGAQFMQPGRLPLVQRDPLRFWQVTSLLLALVVIALIGLRVAGR